ncbi:hypothetical protein EKP94_07755 [Escherichia coli]|nr:hypothetical protein [Escherichia coli]EFH8692562.1 hypothetical protein [Escherichia coli]
MNGIIVSFRGTHLDAFFGRVIGAHTNDRGLLMVDLFCCTRGSAKQVPEADAKSVSRIFASN